MQFKFLLILLFCSTAVFAQIQNEKGNIKFKDGAAVSGTITYYYDNPKIINFYSESGKKETYAPDDIKEILLNNGVRFVAKRHKINTDSTTLLLQTLIESPKISLYTREDEAIPYYYVSKDNRLYRLENNNVLIKQDRRTYKKKDHQYIATLTPLVADRFDLLEKLDKVKLNEHDLTQLILDYNKGDISYYSQSENKVANEPNAVFFAQYSQYKSFLSEPTTAHSSGQLIGIQYYFSKHGRHSVKLALDRSTYRIYREDYKATGVGVRYEYAFKQSEKYSLYLLLHLADVAYVSYKYEKTGDTHETMMLLPKLAPGLGFEIRPLSKFALYGEVNQLMRLKDIPGAFSVGLKYDFGKTSW